jgi:hypothetical protein
MKEAYEFRMTQPPQLHDMFNVLAWLSKPGVALTA